MASRYCSRDEQAFDLVVDLVVASSYGSTGVKRWILGSTAEKVVHHAPVPVLLLRKEKPLRDRIRPDGTRFVRALIPLDGSARSQVAIAPAAALVAALASPGQGECHRTRILVFSKGISETEKEARQQDGGISCVLSTHGIGEGDPLTARLHPLLFLI
jgi:hypothetical protein